MSDWLDELPDSARREMKKTRSNPPQASYEKVGESDWWMRDLRWRFDCMYPGCDQSGTHAHWITP